MNKQQEASQPDSISVGVPIKVVADYPPSEVYSSEPPPAYMRSKSQAIQIARIAAVTLIAVSVILGFFMVASAYVSASVSCYQEYPIQQQENMDDRPSYQHLVDPLDSEETAHNKRESVSHDDEKKEEKDNQEDSPVQFKLPLQLDFDELAGNLIEKNQRSRMNCVVEKRRSEEVLDHQPKTVPLPFGFNLTTEPRIEHVTGERMAIFCESGNDHSKDVTVKVTHDIWEDGMHIAKKEVFRHVPREQQQQQQQQQQQPIMIPIHIQQIPVPNNIQHFEHHGRQFPQSLPQYHNIQQREHRMMHRVPHQQQFKFPPQLPAQLIPEGEQVLLHEEVIPIFHPRPQGRSMEHHPVEAVDHPVPSDVERPPPLPMYSSLPVVQERHDSRPHFVQPRSVRDVESVLKNRVRRCACDCAC